MTQSGSDPLFVDELIDEALVLLAPLHDMLERMFLA
jgi:hypothetical protein